MVAMDMDAFRSAIAKSLGYTVIATFFNVFLYGFTLVQTYQYFNRYSHDRLSLKCLVSLVFLLDTLDSTNLVVVCWRYLISGYADIFLAQVSVWNLSAVPALIGLLSVIVQVFFIYRVSIYSSRIILLLPLILAALASFLASIGVTIACVKLHYLAEFPKAKPISASWLATSALTDILIAVVLISQLKNSRTGFSKDDMLITKLVSSSLRTGFLTAVFSILTLVLYLLPSETVGVPYFLTAFPIPKLYVNSFLAVLLSRARRTSGSVDNKQTKLPIDAHWSDKFSQRQNGDSKPTVKESFALGLGGMLRPQANIQIDDSVVEQVDLESNDVLPRPDRMELEAANKRISEQTSNTQAFKSQDSKMKLKSRERLDSFDREGSQVYLSSSSRPGTSGSMSVYSTGQLSNAPSHSMQVEEPREDPRERMKPKSSVTTIASTDFLHSQRSNWL